MHHLKPSDTPLRFLRSLALVPLLAPLAACGGDLVLLHPAGDVAIQQRDVMLASFYLMMLIIVPVMVLTVLFAWRYRHSNTAAKYDPDWHHSTRLEVVIWAAPLAIIVALGALTWISTHLLDPYRPISRLAPSRPVPAAAKPLKVDVVALDWKWLFIYPDLGVATVNELAAPIDTPLEFHITSSSMMNSFFVPALAGQIYAMPGMETQLHAVANRVGEYNGFSSNYTGAGFAKMNFKMRAMAPADFQAWVQGVRAGGGSLDAPGYLTLARPSEREPVHHFAAVSADLYGKIVNECVDPTNACVSDEMRMDAHDAAKPAGHEPARAPAASAVARAHAQDHHDMHMQMAEQP